MKSNNSHPEPNRAIQSAEARQRICSGQLGGALAAQKAAKADLDRAMEHVHARKADLEKLRASYLSGPVGDLKVARNALDLAEVNASKARERLAEADRLADAMRSTVDDAEREIALAKKAVTTESNKRIASIEWFRGETDEAYRRLLALREELQKTVAFIDGKFGECRSASQALARDRVACPEVAPLDAAHLLVPLIEGRLRELPGAAYELLLVMEAEAVKAKGPPSLASCLSFGVIDQILAARPRDNSSKEHASALKEALSKRDISITAVFEKGAA